jgi:hypothetical protein
VEWRVSGRLEENSIGQLIGFAFGRIAGFAMAR